MRLDDAVFQTDAAWAANDSYLQRLDTNKDGKLSAEEFSKDDMFKDHFGWLGGTRRSRKP